MLFLKFLEKRKLSQITVKDITDIATLNRATFYAHFTDKEDLLDYAFLSNRLKDLNDNLDILNVINEKVLRNIFISIASYQRCCKVSIK